MLFPVGIISVMASMSCLFMLVEMNPEHFLELPNIISERQNSAAKRRENDKWSS
jgi:hypothetical protein